MKKLLGLLFLGLLVSSLSAQQRLTPELLWKIGRVSDEQVSPDGQKIMFGVTYYELSENKGSRDLYLIDLDFSSKKGFPKSKVKQITETPDVSEYNARWTSNGKIAFMAVEDGAMQIWEMNADGSDRNRITDIDGGISDFELGPKDQIVYSKSVKLDQTVNELYEDLPQADARIIDDLMYRHWNQWHDYAYSHVFTMPYPAAGKMSKGGMDVLEGERFDSPVPPFGGSEQYTVTPDGNVVYACKKTADKVEWAKSTNTDLYHHVDGKTENLTQGMMGYDMEATFSPDGQWMAWLSMERDGYESDRNRIFVMEMATGNKMELTKGFPHPAGHLAWSSDSKTIYFTAPVQATYQIFKTEVSKDDPSPVKQITTGQHNFYSVHEAAKGWLIGSRTTMSYPKELFLINPETGEAREISNINQQLLADVEWGKVVPRTVRTTDNKDMLTWVIYPPNFDPNKKYPTLLYCQGGPQSAVSQFFSFRWNFQLMAASDYIIVAPNRRGLPSFGEEWNEAISGDWGGQSMQDYLAAIDDVAKEKYADEDKLGAVGASYGGYSVYQLAGIHEGRFKSFISHCGLYNLESWYAATEEMFFANFDIKGAYWDSPKPKSYEAFSPHKFVQNWDTPILVIHGEKDFRVPINQGMEAFNAAKLRGVPARFLYFPGEGHWVQSPQNGVLWHRVFFDWLDRSLKENEFGQSGGR